jgi:hypothetical protein
MPDKILSTLSPNSYFNLSSTLIVLIIPLKTTIASALFIADASCRI